MEDFLLRMRGPARELRMTRGLLRRGSMYALTLLAFGVAACAPDEEPYSPPTRPNVPAPSLASNSRGVLDAGLPDGGATMRDAADVLDAMREDPGDSEPPADDGGA